MALPLAYIRKAWMSSPPDKPFVYSEIVTHTKLDLMTKLTEYPSPAKKEAIIEAQRRSAEMHELQKQPRL